MERITVALPDGQYQVPPGLEQAAVQRLGQLEDACQRLTARQEEISRRMEELKVQGRQKSAQFRELFAEKLANQHALSWWVDCQSR